MSTAAVDLQSFANADGPLPPFPPPAFSPEQELTPLDEAAARQGLQAAYDGGIRAVAVVLLHGYKYHSHELRSAEIAREVGFTQVFTSGSLPLV